MLLGLHDSVHGRLRVGLFESGSTLRRPLWLLVRINAKRSLMRSATSSLPLVMPQTFPLMTSRDARKGRL